MGKCCAKCSCCGPDPDFEEESLGGQRGGRGNNRKNRVGRRTSYERVEDQGQDDDGDNESG